MTRQKLAPWILLTSLPWSYGLFLFSFGVVSVFVACDLVAFNFLTGHADGWLALSRPATNTIAQYFTSIGRIAKDLTASQLSARVDIVSNVVAGEYMLSLCLTVILLLVLAVEFAKNHSATYDHVLSVIERADKRPRSVVAVYVGFTLAGLIFFYSGASYQYPILYDADIPLLFSLFFVYYAISMPAAMLLLLLCWIASTMCRDGKWKLGIDE
jgi:hypothetical protein